MRSQLAHVFKTYSTRPLVWILGTAIFLLMCALFAQSAGTVDHQSWAAPDLERLGQWKFLPELKTPAPRPVIDPAQVGTLTLMIKPGQPLPDLRDYPEIRTVKLQGTGISAAQISQLHAIPHLTGLQVRVFDLPQGALTLLGEKLMELEVDAALLTRHADELPALRHLHLLRTGGSSLNARTIAAIASIPNLRQLVIGPVNAAAIPFSSDSESQDAWGRLDMTEAALQPLIQHPQLREVYANWSPRLKENRQFLNAVHGYPLYFNQTQGGVLTTCFFLMLMWGLLLMAQLGAQLLPPAAMVIPGFAAPHQWVAGILLSIAFMTCVTGMVMTGISFLPALAIVLFVPAYMAWVGEFRALFSDAPGRAKTLNLALVSIIMVPWLLLMAMSSAPPWVKGVQSWFLQGHYPMATGIGLLIEAGVLGMGFSRLPTMARRKLAMSGISDAAQNRLERMSRGPQAEKTIRQSWLEPQLTNLSYPAGSFWKQVSLLRKGNQFRPVPFLLVFSVCGLLFGALFTPLRFGPPETGRFRFIPNPVLIGSILGQMTMVLMIMPPGLWFRRRAALEMEFCRPVGRRAFARQLFCGLALDQCFALIPMALFVGWMAFLSPSTPRLESLLLMGLCAVGMWLGFYAASVSCFAFKRNWPIAISLLIGFLLAIISFGIVGTYTEKGRISPNFFEKHLYEIILAAGGIILLLLVVISALYRRCCEREWGSRG